MTKGRSVRTRTGRTLSDKQLDAIADEIASTDYDVDQLMTRRRGRPRMGIGPAGVVPVRLDPELRAAVDAAALERDTTASDVIRTAIRRFLEEG